MENAQLFLLYYEAKKLQHHTFALIWQSVPYFNSFSQKAARVADKKQIFNMTDNMRIGIEVPATHLT